jgi:hypothetical protein
MLATGEALKTMTVVVKALFIAGKVSGQKAMAVGVGEKVAHCGHKLSGTGVFI